MRVSIVTVCFNSARTIDNTIRSVLDQTYDDIEFIIIDGNSQDETIDIIKRYANLVSMWISEPDKGLYDAMNKGITMATGELIGFLNSDDIFFSNTVVEEIVNFHRINKIEASVGNIIQHKHNGELVRFYSSNKWNPSKLSLGYMPPHPSIFMKRELFDKFGLYHLGFKIGADYELIVRFFLKNKVNWKFSGITTTSMLIGGLSSSGISSYRVITKEICKALTINNVIFSSFQIKIRFLFKIMEYVKVKKKVEKKIFNI